eukprot:GFUD01119050.1.p1 GENE.GFUD01119050.1~~GFUD01119050.1.p1  ORF type:complete len:124 (+),score=40.02 GFUD01119050.1:35-373(+)
MDLPFLPYLNTIRVESNAITIPVMMQKLPRARLMSLCLVLRLLVLYLIANEPEAMNRHAPTRLRKESILQDTWSPSTIPMMIAGMMISHPPTVRYPNHVWSRVGPKDGVMPS